MLKRAMNNNKPKFYILFFILYIAQLTQCKVAHRRGGSDGSNAKQENLVASGLSSHSGLDSDDSSDSGDDLDDAGGDDIAAGPGNDGGDKKTKLNKGADKNSKLDGGGEQKSKLGSDPKSNSCWVQFGEKTFYGKMDAVDDKYRDARVAYAKEVDTNHFDRRILEEMKKTRAVAERALQKFHGNPDVIPAGLNLGSYCMMRMPGSMLFFYRMKLRNDTRFVVNYIHNDVNQLTMTLRLSLNDLHLVGQYERALTSKEDPSRLYYRPNRGEVEFLLKDVKYKVEGRYRLLDDRLHIEHIISEIPPMEILMRYSTDNAAGGTPLQYETLKEYLDRMKNDLDLWLKDYLNDFLMIFGFEEANRNKEMINYENERTMIMNEYADKVIDILNDRMREMGGQFLMPDFVLTAVNGMEIKLYDGTVRGVDSMYRRSVATGKVILERRFLDADIGFSGLKAEYRYDTYVKTGMPPVSGVFVLNADDIYAHMALDITDPKVAATVDVEVTFKQHGKPESLTIEGPANRIVANFNHLLEQHIITIMSSMLIYNVKSISSLTKCDPGIKGRPDKDDDGPTPPTDDDGPTPPNDDGPTPPTDDDGPTPPNDDDPTPPTDDDGPTPPNDDDPTPPTDDDGPTPPNDDDPTPPTDDDGPTPPNDDDPTPPNDDDPTPPDNDDDGPTPPDNDVDGPTPPDNDDDGPTPPDDDGPTPPDNDDDGPMPPDDDGPMPPDNDDDGPTAPKNDGPAPPDDEEDAKLKLKPDFGFLRKESIELELPPGSPVGGSYKIDHKDELTMTRLIGDDQKLKNNESKKK